jgi:hypothetical protein
MNHDEERFGAAAAAQRLLWLQRELTDLRRNIDEMNSRANLLSAWTASLAADLWADGAGADVTPAAPRVRPSAHTD